MLRNLKKFGAEEGHLLEVYYQPIRSIVEMACPVWSPGLTQQEIGTTERVQRTSAMAIIRAEHNSTYQEAIDYFKIGSLQSRREAICLNFAIKAFKHPRFTNWFVINDGIRNTRSTKDPLKIMKTRTRRFRKSPIP